MLVFGSFHPRRWWLSLGLVVVEYLETKITCVVVVDRFNLVEKFFLRCQLSGIKYP